VLSQQQLTGAAPTTAAPALLACPTEKLKSPLCCSSSISVAFCNKIMKSLPYFKYFCDAVYKHDNNFY